MQYKCNIAHKKQNAYIIINAQFCVHHPPCLYVGFWALVTTPGPERLSLAGPRTQAGTEAL